MCLNVYTVKKELKPSKSKKDIVCYKIMVESIDGSYITPYQSMPVSNDVIDGKVPMYSSGSESVDFYDRCWIPRENIFALSRGFIHTFKSLRDAKRHTSFTYANDATRLIVFKCIIPSGTAYYKGKDSYEKDGYASKEIVFIEKEFEVNL